MSERSYNVLFLCTGNSARSIIAESLLNKLGEGRFHAYSAGSFPKGAVHPAAIRVLEKNGYPTQGARSKSWEEFSSADAPVMDFIFTVCDNAAGEVCPIWPGHPMTAHWGIEDPAAVTTSEEAQTRAFNTVLVHLKTRISLFLALPLASIERMALGKRLREIGESEGATFARAESAPAP